jgi:hypothetical protein
MLKMLQLDINERTEALDALRLKNKALEPAQEAELQQLKKDQDGIIDLARDLIQPRRDDAQED